MSLRTFLRSLIGLPPKSLVTGSFRIGSDATLDCSRFDPQRPLTFASTTPLDPSDRPDSTGP